MEVKPTNRRGDLRTLEYVLDDFLELKVRLDTKKTAAVKQFLLSQPWNGHPLSSVEGFLLDKHLVVFHEGDPRAVNRLIFLNPGDGRIRVKSVAP